MHNLNEDVDYTILDNFPGLLCAAGWRREEAAIAGDSYGRYIRLGVAGSLATAQPCLSAQDLLPQSQCGSDATHRLRTPL